VIENLPGVRVAARLIFRLLPDHVSFARIYSAGVMGLVSALEEFHASNLVGFTRLRLQRADLKERLAGAVKNLPERERLVLNLSYHEELTLKEIALVLDEPEPRVSRIHASAILHLRSELSDWGYR
jgi:DNA-directed RNA polymerase specialized sigma subunit